MQIVQIVLIVLIILIVIGVMLYLLFGNQSKQQKRSMEVIRGSQKYDDPMADQNKRREQIAKKLKDSKSDEETEKKKKVTLSLQLEQAGLSISPKTYWIYAVISMLVFVGGAKFMGQPVFVLGMAAVVGLFGFPKLIIKRKAAKRQKNFLEEFPDALEAMVRLLKAGMPVAEAISMISREFEGPVGEEMSKVYDKQKIGVPLHEAAQESSRTMPITEMQMFATGLAIQAQTGSSLSEVLTNLSNVIRARFRLKRKIKALSSEAIASASIIGALPILVATGMYFANYEYISVLFYDDFGNVLLAGAVIWMCVGIFVMKVMINFKV